MKTYNKLVRDKIPLIIKKAGKKPFVEELSEDEYKKELDKKLKEEISEYLESKSIEELTDIEEVTRAILKLNKVTMKEFNKIRIKKVKERGSFKKRIKLIKVED